MTMPLLLILLLRSKTCGMDIKYKDNIETNSIYKDIQIRQE